MKIIISILILALSCIANADCAQTIQIDNTEYCIELNWGMADKMANNKLEATTTLSPILIKSKTKPANWLYSKLNINIWQKDDLQKNLLAPTNFKVFPFMKMSNGHHHSTSHGFYTNLPDYSFTLDGMGFMEMKGCWEIRWTLEPNLTEEKSNSLLVLENFKNLTPEENAVVCQ